MMECKVLDCRVNGLDTFCDLDIYPMIKKGLRGLENKLYICILEVLNVYIHLKIFYNIF